MINLVSDNNMKKKIGLVSGITGQDGSYLADLLLSNGYEVHGLVRQSTQFTPDRWGHLAGAMVDENFHVHHGDLNDAAGLRNLLETIMPDEVYNLGAMSQVRISFDTPIYAAQVNAVGVLNMLEAIRTGAPQARFYQASSSECFGNNVDSDGY